MTSPGDSTLHFMFLGESIEMACEREIHEEVGLRVEDVPVRGESTVAHAVRPDGGM